MTQPREPSRPPRDQDIPVSRAIGRFFGHLAAAVRPPTNPKAHSSPTPAAGQGTNECTNRGPSRARRVSERRETESREVDGQRVILRRTTIEEIELPGPENTGN